MGHPCVPCAGLTRVTIRTELEKEGRTWWGGGGRYEAQRVKAGFHCIHMFVCKHDENRGLCECGYVIRVLINFISVYI